MSNIVQIPASRWEKDLLDILETEFDSDLPDPKHATIYGSYDETGRLESFIISERIIMIGQIYVRPDRREKNNGQIVKRLVKFIVDKLPEGISVGAVASEERFEGLFRLFRMTNIKGKFFRRNL